MPKDVAISQLLWASFLMFDYPVVTGFFLHLNWNFPCLLFLGEEVSLDACVCYITFMFPKFWKCIHVLIFISFCKVSLSPLKAYRAAMQTQWSWILQLCHCVEQHLRENAAYFEVRM